MTDFKNIEYLKSGNKRQTEAYETLTKNKVLEALAEFDPILVGTIPINIAIENSDLDIVCYWQNKKHFTERITSLFKDKTNFKISETTINQEESVIGSFILDGFEIEVFGQNIPTQNQNGYRHMIIEHEILQSRDENFRKEIIKLKQNGYKTEPAFGKLLGLKIDPYLELLNYKI